jgi:alkylation response protein AidB-like acyl-CoA dehydrogenase
MSSIGTRQALTAAEAVDVAAELAADFKTRAAEYDAAGVFPEEDFVQIRRSGLLGLMVPERLGGVGASFADYVEVAMNLAGGNAATALIYNMHASVTGSLALTSDDLARSLGVPESFFMARDRALREAADGAFYAVAMSERGAGSRLSQLTTTYGPVSGGYRIRGSKSFCSGAGHADAYVVAARSVDGASKVSQFLLPGTASGILVEETWDSLGMRATASHDLHLDVEVPQDALLGGVEGLGLLVAQAMPQWLVASYSAVYVGVARATIDAAVDYARGRGLERLPAVRARFGRADAAVAAAREVLREAAQRVDDAPGEPETNRWVWRAKLLSGETAMDVAASMLEACGTGATRRGSALERLYRDARCGSLQPATSDVCADWLGTAALGLDPDEQSGVGRW